MATSAPVEIDRKPRYWKVRSLFLFESTDPHIMNIDLVNEYLVCQKYYSMNITDFKQSNLMALEHSFLNRDKKESIRQKYYS